MAPLDVVPQVPQALPIANRLLTLTTSSCVKLPNDTLCGQNDAPHKEIHILNLRTCEYVTLYGKRDFADVINNFEMGKLIWIIEVGPM